jgi:hydroxymethylpyrimidine/phosphomethylpyrimidine kinase
MTKTFERVMTKVLTIAGSDSSGGAGIQADLKTISALGCYGMSVVTAITAQNTQAVRAVYPVPPSFVEEQLEAVLSDMGADAVKIGMLHSAEIIEAVARQLKRFSSPNVVLDPVMAAESGALLLKKDALRALKGLLLPLATVLTPNLQEAAALLDRPIEAPLDVEQAARDLAGFGTPCILVKGGHSGAPDSNDWLYLAEQERTLIIPGERIHTRNNHGTGCTLASAIACYLAKGLGIEEAVRKAKTYVTEAIRAGSTYRIGHGHGPLHHFFHFW